MTEPQVRVGDTERESAVTALGEHYAAGRLTREEFDERAGSAWSARTRADLEALFVDLPRPAGPSVPAAVPTGPVAAGHHGGHLGGLRAVLVPMAVVLLGLTVLTHLPLILFAAVLWFVVVHRHGQSRGHRRWAGGRLR